MSALASPGLLKDHEWHQSDVGQLLRCPRAFALQHVEKRGRDHEVSGYAAPLGTADHAAIAWGLERLKGGLDVDKDSLLDAALEGFEGAVERAHQQGEHTDPEGLERALEQLEGVRLERLQRLLADPRVLAIDWRGVEAEFDLHAGGRHWAGTIDAWGVATRDVPCFGKDGREEVGLRRGEHVLVDWKTGSATPLGFMARTLSTQLAIYQMALAPQHPGVQWRAFLAHVQDLDLNQRPKDAAGDFIPKRIKQLNPAFADALGMEPDEAATSRKRPKDAFGNGIPKRIERLNPAWKAAANQPKGPLFHECRVAWPVVLTTIQAALQAAEAGLFPATGAATGGCLRCPYRSTCTETQPQPKEG